MRIIFAFSFILLFAVFLRAQRHDYQFRVGSYCNGEPYSNGLSPSTIMDFNFDSLTFQFDFNPEITAQYFRSSASATDSFGNVLLSFNGYALCGADGVTIEDGFKVIEDETYNENGAHNTSTSMPQCMFFLEQPGNLDKYFLFYPYCPASWGSDIRENRFSIIDLSPGNPTLLVKDSVLRSDLGSSLGATKHANGRDWWLIAGDREELAIHTWLFDPNGLHYTGKQQVDGISSPPHSEISPSFNAQGTKVLFHKAGDLCPDPTYLQLYDFDRCIGILSNGREHDLETLLPHGLDSACVNWFTGTIFSPNGKFFYLPYWINYFPDSLPFSLVHGIYQGELNSQNNFFLNPIDLELGSDPSGRGPSGKLEWRRLFRTPTDEIVVGAGDAFYAHIIREPDSAGLDCRLENIAIDFWTDHVQPNGGLDTFYSIGNGLPVSINHRLYAVEGSTCDTLGIDGPPLAARFKWFPRDLEVQFQDRSFQDHDEWYWEYGDGNVGTEKHPVHSYDAPGRYTVCLNISRGDSISSLWCDEIEVFGPVSTDDISVTQGEFSIFPNPGLTGSKATWTGAATALKQYTIDGKLVDEMTLSAGMREVIVRRPFSAVGYSIVVLERNGVIIGRARIFWR